MWEMGHKEAWALKNWCFWTVELAKTLESPLDCKKIHQVNPKGNQSWIFTGMTDAEAETPILWPPDVKNWLTGKDPDAGKGFPAGSAGKEFACNVGDLSLIPGLGRSPGEGKAYSLQYSCLENPLGQRCLAGYSPWGGKESDMTEQLTLSQSKTHIHT